MEYLLTLQAGKRTRSRASVTAVHEAVIEIILLERVLFNEKIQRFDTTRV